MTKHFVSKKTHRDYARRNKETWAKLGFRLATIMVHDDDRAVALGNGELRRNEKMLEMAEDKETPLAMLRHISERNMYPVPHKSDFDLLDKKAEDYDNYLELKQMIDYARKTLRKYKGIEANVEDAATEENETRMIAKAVACANVIGALLKLIDVTMDNSPAKGTDGVTKVFAEK